MSSRGRWRGTGGSEYVCVSVCTGGLLGCWDLPKLPLQPLPVLAYFVPLEASQTQFQEKMKLEMVLNDP